MAEYAIILYANKDEISSDVDGPERGAHDQHSEELQEGGSMIAAFALEPFDTATSIRMDAVTDGPFIEAKEVVLGFYVIEATDLDEALAVAKRNPIIAQGGGVEVRPVQGFVVRTTLDE